MKAGVADIVGKQITGVVVADNERPPRQQVFLLFSDGTSFEFYGDQFSCTGGLDRHDAADAIRYARKAGAAIRQVHPKSEPDSAPTDLAGFLGAFARLDDGGDETHGITRKRAWEIATAAAHDAGLGAVYDVLAWAENPARKPALYGAGTDLAHSWVAYLEPPQTKLASSWVVLVDQRSGEVVYVGDARDEG